MSYTFPFTPSWQQKVLLLCIFGCLLFTSLLPFGESAWFNVRSKGELYDISSDRDSSETEEINSIKVSHWETRERLRSHWSSIERPDQLPCASPKYKGHVEKGALGPLSPTIKISPSTVSSLMKDQIPVYSTCQVYISHKWRFIYIRQPKASSSSVIMAIKKLFCEGVKCTKQELAPIFYLEETTWKDYFVFTVVRNPWTRLLSAYHMFNNHKLRKRDDSVVGGNVVPGEPCGLPFLDFTKNTNQMLQLCSTQNCCAFVASKGSARWLPHFVDQHVADQSHCMFMPNGVPLVDYVGATETIDEDWLEIMEEISKSSGRDFKRLPLEQRNKGTKGDSSSLCESEAITQFLNETTLYNIAIQYSQDVVRLGYGL